MTKKESLLDGQSMLEKLVLHRRPNDYKKLFKQTRFARECNRPLAIACGSFINGFDDAKQLVYTVLAKAIYAMRTSFYSLEQWLPIVTWLYHLLPILI
jgi:hypothetical protein